MTSGAPSRAGIRYVSSEVERMAGRLNIGREGQKWALRIYYRVLESEYGPPTLDDISAACLYLGDQMMDQEATLRDIETVARRDMNRIQTIADSVRNELSLDIKIQTPDSVLESKCEALGIAEHEKKLKRLLQEVDDHYVGSKAPTSVAAGLIYIGTDVFGYELTQGDIADELNTTKQTIRNRYPEILDRSTIVPPKSKRKLSSFEEALAAFQDDFDLPDALIEEAGARVTLVKRDLGPSVSKAGVVLAALYVTFEEWNEFDDLADTDALSQYADVTSQTIERHIDHIIHA